jgi:undecaprenyl-phosphate 4-deoxy-4-formamido-L-arabinose transferase
LNIDATKDIHGQLVELSVLIPVFNEQDVLEILFDRLYSVMDGLGRPFEILFINDGSSDNSADILAQQFEKRPDVTRVISLSSNAGQHAALIAGFERTRGKFIITLDADLQNPPEEIPAIVAEMDKGFDYVGSIRASRHDKAWRHVASRLMNSLREKITNIHMTDQGCMLRGYSRDIALEIADSNESRTFIPALAYLYAARPTEITVAHEERAAGQSKYSLFKLIQLNFDLVTSFSSVPLQLISITGIFVSIISLLFVCYLAYRRIFYGPEVEGVFTLFGITIFLMGLLLFSVGMLGEYIGRINGLVRRRKRFRVASVLEAGEGVKLPADESKSSSIPDLT